MLYMGVLIVSHRSTEPMGCTKSSLSLIHSQGFRGKLVWSKFVIPQFHGRKISRICSWRSIPVVIYGSESPAPSPAGFRDTGIFGD